MKHSGLYKTSTALFLYEFYFKNFRYNRKSLKVLGTVGEPINPEAWLWYYHTVGDERCVIVDTYWQTETVSIQKHKNLIKHCRLLALTEYM